MKLLLFIALVGGLNALPSQERVGCDQNPCDHQCVDTVDSYYCLCYQNWVLQADGHSCRPAAQADYDAAYLGCWEDKEAHRDLPYLIWSRPEDCTIQSCMHDCRGRGFRFAGLQNGNECWCGNTFQRAYYENGTCNMPCPGSTSQTCGGAAANSIFKVTRDSRYVGCYYEDANSPDMTEVLWGKTDGRSVDQCTVECSRKGYLYAGIFDGGQCSCGNDYGKYGLAGEAWCMVRCTDGFASQNCGGNSSNAIYRIERGRDFSALEAKFTEEDIRATLAADEMYIYPSTQGMYARRLVLYASDTVNNIKDDVACTNGDCYGLCGTIDEPEGFDKHRADVKIRRFHIKLSELANEIEYPDDAQRVFLYAQTVYIDQSVDFPWSLYIRARQVIINYAANPSITFDHTGPEFGLNISEALVTGAPSDLTFQKISLMCARMLLASEDDQENRLAWNIIDDLVRDRAYTTEQKHFLDAVRGYRSLFSSIGRNDLHWAPYYTRNFYVNTLNAYHFQIEDYRDTYKELLNDAIECNTFHDRASSLITIWTDSMVAQSRILRDHAEQNLQLSEETYERIYVEYNESREELVAAGEVFKQGLEDWKKEQTRKAMFGLISSCVKLAFGVFPCGARDTAKGISEAVDGVIVGLELLEVTMENLAKTMEELEAFLLITDEIIETKDYERYMDNVEAVAGLYVILPEWNNFKYQIDVIFRDEEFRFIDGALAFSFAVFDLCNWGEALTRSMIEFANNIRVMVTFDSLYENRVQMKERYDQYFSEIAEDCHNKDLMVVAFAEQHYDIMLELNNQLIQFCEAHYYETLSICPEGARPNFALSVDDLLSAVYQAKLSAESLFRSSSYEKGIEIKDSEEAWANCTDSKICPVKIFRESRMLYYELPTDHRDFLNIDLILVEEIQLELPGAVSTDGTTDFRLRISSSGPFINRLDDKESIFLTRALTEMIFQYDIVTGDIEFSADLYKPGGGGSMIKHMTPFTTWLIQVDPLWTHIDISGVDTIILKLLGPYKNFKKDEEPLKPRLA